MARDKGRALLLENRKDGPVPSPNWKPGDGKTLEHAARAPDEIAIDLHHQLVAIHVSPNGNGRHARLAADLLAERLGRRIFSWGRTDLVNGGDARIAYVAALKAVDAGDLGALLSSHAPESPATLSIMFQLIHDDREWVYRSSCETGGHLSQQ